MNCEACEARESEIRFLREMVTRLTEKPVVMPSPPQKPYVGLVDGGVEFVHEDEDVLEDAEA